MSTAATKTATQQSSTIRSPTVPHAAFWTGSLLLKVFFPATLEWLAYDSIATLLLSVWYPLCATIALIHREETQQRRNGSNANTKIIDTMQLERKFWIEYWSVGFAGVQCLHQFVSNIPSLQQMGRYEYPQVPIFLMEIKLLFFVWTFAMEPILNRYQRFLGISQKQERWKKFLPLPMLTQTIGPRLMRIQMAISERISRDTWQRLIHNKAQRVLELMVVMQFLHEDTMTYLLKLLEEGRSLLLLSVFAVLPASIGQIGLLYAQFVFPSARSLAFRGQAMEVLSLKYWVLNSMLTLFLSATWWIWWFMPFSRQIVLGVRCFATFPSTIVHHYANVEMELITFGILKGEPKLAVKETRTVQALRAVVKRLPRDRQASSFQFEIDDSHSDSNSNDDKDEESSVGSVDTTESEEERRRQRRREKRAMKRLLKQQKLAESQGQPPPLLQETIVAQYSNDNDSDVNTQQTDSVVDVIDLTEYLSCSSDKEERDARNAAAKESTSRADIGYTKSAGSNHTSSMRSNHISIGTPTETSIGEVEVQVRPKTGSTNRRYAPLFPITYPRSSASYEGSLGRQSSMSLSGAPQSSNDDSDSFFSSNSMNEDQRTIVSSGGVDYEIISAPRRSTRLEQLREWQEQKRLKEEEEKLAKKKKSSRSKPRPEGTSLTKSGDKKSKKSKTSTGEKSDKSSPKKSKKSKTSPTKDGKKKAASPDKSTKRSKKKGEAPLEAEGETKPNKERVPNSLKKKKKKEYGGLLNR